MKKKMSAALGVFLVALFAVVGLSQPASAATLCKTSPAVNRTSADSGEHGNWATTTVDRTTKVCTDGGTGDTWTYKATVTDSGEFVTLADAKSPGEFATTLAGGVKGTVNGSFEATFTAAADFNGVEAFIDPAPQTTTGEWVAAVFPGPVTFDEAGSVAKWSWTYNLCGENGEWWVNAEKGNSGDITEKPCPTPSPSPSASESESPSPSPSASESESPSPSPSASESESPSPSVSPSVEPSSTTTVEPTPSESETAIVPVGNDSNDSGGLPVTGAKVGFIVGLGAFLLGGGALLYVATRRRREDTDQVELA